MKQKRLLALAIVASMLLAPVSIPRTSGQADTQSCSAIVRSALAVTGEFCDGTGRNKACYGNILVEADPQSDALDFRFDHRGDIVDVADMQSLRTSPMDLVKGEWGVALMRLQAMLTDLDPARNITLVLMGNAALQPVSVAGPVSQTIDVEPRGVSRLNIRQSPTMSSAVVGKLNPGERITATGRLADNSWLRVELPAGGEGWILANLLTSSQSVSGLAPVAVSATRAGPMHAFYFTSEANDAACPEAPESGLLIQTPEGVAEVTLLINEVDIQLGSTVFIQASASAGLGIYVVEGHARVTSFGLSELVPAGAFSAVPLDASYRAAGPPLDAKPYDLTHVVALPLALLERPITIAPPADDGDNTVGVPLLPAPADETEPTWDGAEDDSGAGGPKDKERPGNPQPPANPQPPGNPEPPGDPPPLSDFVPGATTDKVKEKKDKS